MNNPYKEAAQQAKADALAAFLIQCNIPLSDLDLFGAEQWKLAAKGASVNTPSAEVVALVKTILAKRAARPASKSVFPTF